MAPPPAIHFNASCSVAFEALEEGLKQQNWQTKVSPFCGSAVHKQEHQGYIKQHQHQHIHAQQHLTAFSGLTTRRRLSTVVLGACFGSSHGFSVLLNGALTPNPGRRRGSNRKQSGSQAAALLPEPLPPHMVFTCSQILCILFRQTLLFYPQMPEHVARAGRLIKINRNRIFF